MNMIFSLWQGLKDFIRGDIVDKSISEQRYNTCLNCPAKHPTRKICTACGCYLPVKVKLKNSQCPMDMWEK